MFDRFRALSVRQQIVLIVSGLVVIWAILGSAWYFVLRVPYDVLFTRLRSADAAAIVADLDRKKIPYRLSDGGETILVPVDLIDRTRLSVMTEDVPLRGTVGFELFDKSDMGLTDFAQKINYQRALQGELERTVQTLDGVDTARVHLSLGEERVFRDDQIPPKASVTIRMQKGAQLSANTAQGIQRLVAAAVPNLDAANVVILDEKGLLVGLQSAPHAEPTALSPLEQERRSVEQYYEAQARLALDRVYPLAGLAVAVTAGAVSQPTGTPAAPADWNPAARNFPLNVTISAPATFDPAARENVRSIVVGALGFDPSKSDAITFGPQAAEAVPTVPPRPGVRRISNLRTPPAERPAEFPELAAAATLFVFLVAAVFALVWVLLRPRRLSETGRSRMVARFRELLRDGADDVVS